MLRDLPKYLWNLAQNKSFIAIPLIGSLLFTIPFTTATIANTMGIKEWAQERRIKKEARELWRSGMRRKAIQRKIDRWNAAYPVTINDDGKIDRRRR